MIEYIYGLLIGAALVGAYFLIRWGGSRNHYRGHGAPVPVEEFRLDTKTGEVSMILPAMLTDSDKMRLMGIIEGIKSCPDMDYLK